MALLYQIELQKRQIAVKTQLIFGLMLELLTQFGSLRLTGSHRVNR